MTDVLTLDVAGDVDVAVATSNGLSSTAVAVADWTMTGVKDVIIEDDLVVGSGRSSLSGGDVVSSGTAQITGTGGGDLDIGEDLEVGRSSFSTHVGGNVDGALTVTSFADVRVDDAFEVGVSEPVLAGNANSIRNTGITTDGRVHLADIDRVIVGDEMKTGTAVIPAGVDSGRGYLTFGQLSVERVNQVQIASQWQLGQVVVDDQALVTDANNLVGTASLSDVGNVSVGSDLGIATVHMGLGDVALDAIGELFVERVGELHVAGSVDVGRVVDTSTAANNSAVVDSSLRISDSTVRIDDAMRIATVEVNQFNNQITPVGVVDLYDSDLDVGGSITIGGVTDGAGFQPYKAILTVNDSTVHADSMAIAAGVLSDSSTGQLDVANSLISLDSRLTMGAGSHMTFDIDGPVRGDEYGAIDSGGLVVVDGTAVVNFNFTPTLESVFDLILLDNVLPMVGVFDDVNFTGLDPNATVTMGVESVVMGGNSVEVLRVRVVPETIDPRIAGDANGDDRVDAADLNAMALNWQKMVANASARRLHR